MQCRPFRLDHVCDHKYAWWRCLPVSRLAGVRARQFTGTGNGAETPYTTARRNMWARQHGMKMSRLFVPFMDRDLYSGPIAIPVMLVLSILSIFLRFSFFVPMCRLGLAFDLPVQQSRHQFCFEVIWVLGLKVNMSVGDLETVNCSQDNPAKIYSQYGHNMAYIQDRAYQQTRSVKGEIGPGTKDRLAVSSAY